MDKKVLKGSWPILGLIVFLCNCEKPNTPPIADFSFSPAIGNTDTVFRFDASLSSDAEDEMSVLQVHWDWTNDGIWDTDFSSNKIISYQFQNIKGYTVVLEVKDSKGLVSSISKVIPVSPSLPVIATGNVLNIKSTSADANSNVIKDGGAAVDARGICWSINENPTTSNNNTVVGSGIGLFTCTLDNLTKNTNYYIRAYASNVAGTSYGNQVSFKTANTLLPAVSTTSITNIVGGTATGGGNVFFDGNTTVTARGVCWSTFENPTISDYKTVDGTGTGIFSSSLTKLMANTTYFVRAYANNSEGIAYGEQVNFLVPENDPHLNAGWHFDEGTGTTATAFSTIKHVATFKRGNATIMGTAAADPAWVAGVKGGKAIYLTGGAHLEVPYNAAFLPTNLSISVWVKPEVLRADNYIVSQNYWNGYKLQTQDGGKPFFTYKKIDGGIIDTDNETDNCIKIDVWNHIVVTVNAVTKELKFFVNGMLTKTWTESNKGVGPLTQTLTPSAQPFIIGCVATDAELAANFMEWTTAANLGYFKGAIDELKIYDIALTDVQVLKIFNDEKPN